MKVTLEPNALVVNITPTDLVKIHKNIEYVSGDEYHWVVKEVVRELKYWDNDTQALVFEAVVRAMRISKQHKDILMECLQQESRSVELEGI